MKILSIKVLRGPNYWSCNHKKLIQMKLDLQKFEYLPSNLIKDFNTKLKQLIPSLYEHYCSPGRLGGFFERLDEGTWLGHVLEHIALELQTLAGMFVGYGRTRSVKGEFGVYHVTFSYEIEEAGLYAAKAAYNITKCLAQGKIYTKLDKDIEELKRLYEQLTPGPSTRAIVQEAYNKNIPFIKFKDSSLITLGHGCKQKKMWATVAADTKAIGVDIVSDKQLTKEILYENFLPVPKGEVVTSAKELKSVIAKIGFPLVIKPFNGNHGRGINCNVNSMEKALHCYRIAKKISKKVVVEEYIKGFDYRFLLVNFKVVAVAQRTPAHIVGDGVSTIQQLIDNINLHPDRGNGHEKILTKINIDYTTLSILEEKNLSLDSVLEKNKILYLKYAANLSSGGIASDVTQLVNPKTIKLIERAARAVNLDLCGIDVVAGDITKPICDSLNPQFHNGAIIEINACPGLRMHLKPTIGEGRNVAKIIVDNLFPKAEDAKIPIVAVTGTNAKTTVVRLVAHIAQQSGKKTGFTTTDGIYIDSELIYSGDCSGPNSAKTVLYEPSVEYAVLECARGGIIRAGLGFNECDISIITNITEDHLGIDDIYCIEDLKRVKSVLAYSTKKEGFTILNAEDDLVYSLKDEIQCNVALFALKENSRITEHYKNGGTAAFVKDEHLIIAQGLQTYNLGSVIDIPTTLNGTLTLMVQNLLPAVLAGFLSGFSLENITQAIHKFNTSHEYTPGRMNLFDFNNFKVMVDYAHNEGAYLEIKKFLDSIKCSKKVGIIGAAGDRLAEDIKKLGFTSAKMFDEVIIRHNKDGRGRSNQELTDLIMQGIKDSNSEIKVKVISDECEAIEDAINEAEPDTFIFYSVDNVNTALNKIQKELKNLKDV